MVLPTAYWAPASYFRLRLQGAVTEVMETFEKQTFRNRCLIRDARGNELRLTVPVKKVEHKQMTRDIEISYQSRWQHQHWTALVSAYEHTPYFFYYADFFRPFYEKQTRWLVDLNESIGSVTEMLLKNMPEGAARMPQTTDWSGLTWTDRHPWQKEPSIATMLFEYGPEAINKI